MAHVALSTLGIDCRPRDGEKFLMLRERPEQRRHIVATLNWIEDLKSKAPR